MRVFLTGATGFIGSALVPELIHAGHQVLGLTRSEAGTNMLIAAGADVHRGSLEDVNSLRLGTAKADAVIHCAYDHDFSKLEESCRKEHLAIEALGSALIGTDRSLVITSVTALGAPSPGQVATENYYSPHHPSPRASTENAAAAVADHGVNVSVVRLSQVHSPVKQGFVSALIGVARDKGVPAYIGEGTARWPAVHLLDVVRLYRLALEKKVAGSRYHAVAEDGIPLQKIAEMIGDVLKIPVVGLSPDEAKSHFGWLSMFVGMDMPASSLLTRQRLDWRPVGPGLLRDLEQI